MTIIRNIYLIFTLTALGIFTTVSSINGAQAENTVVVYAALDQIFSEPVLKIFEKETGIKVKAVYDIEAVKTTGLVNRLIAEKRHPQCDVFWNNEVIRTIALKRKGILAPYHSPSATDIPDQFKDKESYWTGFAARARVIVVNTTLVSEDTMPQSLFDLTTPEWKNKVAMANPLFGTTATHVAALFAHLETVKAENLFSGLKKNQIRIVDGNSVVKDQVGGGVIPLGLTDTDDVNVGVLSGMHIEATYPDKKGMGTLLIPNAVSLIANCPHPEAGKKLIDFLLSTQVEEILAFGPSVQMPVRETVPTPEGFVSIGQIAAMDVDFEQVADMYEPAIQYVQALFIQ